MDISLELQHLWQSEDVAKLLLNDGRREILDHYPVVAAGESEVRDDQHERRASCISR